MTTTPAELVGPRQRVVERIRELLEAHAAGPWTRDATWLTVVTGLLMLVGLVMSFSASVVDGAESGDPFWILRRQLLWVGLGLPILWLVSRLHPRIWRGLSWLLMACSLAGLVLVLVPGVGITAGGSTRWLGFGSWMAQPSEVAKLATVLWLADVTARKRAVSPDGRLPVRHLMIPAIPLLFLQVILIMAEPDLGTTVIIGLIVATVLFAEGLPLRLFAGAMAAMTALAALATVAAPYRMDRIQGWLDPQAVPTKEGYQLLQSLYALGNGGWTGVGLGSSRGKWNFIPNPETDFVFAIIGEELGLLGAVLVIGLFGWLLVVGLRIARQADGFARTVAFTITGWIVGQAIINIATVIGLLPITGMTLPLVSAGGSSLIATLVSLGILVAIARTLDSPPTLKAR